ncbi:MAG: hypothetical protein ABI844_04740 [Saprospiraceae bacterium]
MKPILSTGKNKKSTMPENTHQTFHITSGIRKILEIPKVYDLWQNFVGNKKALKRYTHEYICPNAGDKILDICCVTGYILKFLPKKLNRLD